MWAGVKDVLSFSLGGKLSSLQGELYVHFGPVPIDTYKSTASYGGTKLRVWPVWPGIQTVSLKKR
jgi:hypothetical protein